MTGLRLQLDLIRRRDFGLLFWGGMITRIGDGFTLFALGWFFAQRGDPKGFAITLVAYEVAAILGGIALTGVLDRVSRRRIAVLDSMIRGSAVAVIPVVALFHDPGLGTILPAVALLGLWSPTADVAARAMTVDIVATEELNAANGLEGVQWTLGWLLGPLLGSLAVKGFGTVQAFWFDAASFFVYALALAAMSAAADRVPVREGRQRMWTELRDGVNYVRREPTILVIVQLTAVANVAFGMAMVALPFLVVSHGAGPGTLGLLDASAGVGAVLGSILAGAVRWSGPATRTLTVIYLLSSLPIMVIGLDPALWIVGIIWFATSLGSAPANVLMLTMRQRIIPAELLGRVLSLTMLLNRGGHPAGQAIGGVLVRPIGAAATIFWSGAFGVANAATTIGIRGWWANAMRLTDRTAA